MGVLQCPDCGRIIMDETGNGGYKLRSRMVVFKDGKAEALCPTCKKAVEIPVILGSTENMLPKPKVIIEIKRAASN